MFYGTGRMLVLTSYYCVDDLDEWSRQLRGLTERLGKEKNRKQKGRNKVLLLGSPVYFPNYKVPFWIEEAGLSLFCRQITPAFLYRREPSQTMRTGKNLRRMFTGTMLLLLMYPAWWWILGDKTARSSTWTAITT